MAAGGCGTDSENKTENVIINIRKRKDIVIMAISLQKGQKVDLTKGNPGLGSGL